MRSILNLAYLIYFLFFQVRKLPGIELSKEEQLQQIDSLRKQLTLKRDLLNKYRSLSNSFDRETQA